MLTKLSSGSPTSCPLRSLEKGRERTCMVPVRTFLLNTHERKSVRERERARKRTRERARGRFFKRGRGLALERASRASPVFVLQSSFSCLVRKGVSLCKQNFPRSCLTPIPWAVRKRGENHGEREREREREREGE